MPKKTIKPNEVAAQHQKTTAMQFIRTVYLSLAALIGLVVFVIGMAGAVRVALNQYVFHVDEYVSYYSPYENGPCTYTPTIAEGKTTANTRTKEEIAECEQKMEESNKRNAENNVRRELSQSAALALVGFPVWIFHFLVMQADWRRRRQLS